MDAFAVSIAAGLSVSRLTGRHVFRVAFHFGLFQFMMTVLGWLCFRSIADTIKDWDHWIAFGLLTFIGLKMLFEAFQPEKHKRRKDLSRGWLLVVMSVATSIDAFAVGMSLAVLDVGVWFPGVIIGLVAAVLSAAGIYFGSRIGRKSVRWAEALGGVVLIAIGVHVLAAHMCW